MVDHRSFDGRDSFDAALAAEIDRFAPDLVVLAGFMRILTPAFVRRYEGRLLNIHPSLLPSFKGIHTHQQALDAGVALHGASVHFVIPELDSGAIVAQGAVPVRAGDDAAARAARVLTVEHVVSARGALVHRGASAPRERPCSGGAGRGALDFRGSTAYRNE